ncbi:cytochrome c oxidase assembly protein [Streptomyces sp. NPDC004680]|uniref:cytochrome c oxidase assembly protein n=1 Tax=Streptomyces sp. NPDC004680 TaxID=3154287 RepID=UPI0033B563DD
MDGMHHHNGGTSLPWTSLTALLLLLAAGSAYLLAAQHARRRNRARGWSTWRTTSFVTGLALLAVGLLPPLNSTAHTDFRAHMAQHMLIGMYAPQALVLAAPLTLLLRTLPTSTARKVTALLHSRPARVPAHPATAFALSTGSLAALYFTPLYNTAWGHPAGHWLIHAHFLASGCLLAHAIAGPDPAPARPAVRARLVYLGAAITAHALIAQAMYGGFFVDIHAPISQVQQGAEIMYYGGDIAELLLAATLITTWRPERRTKAVTMTPKPGPRAGAPAPR